MSDAAPWKKLWDKGAPWHVANPRAEFISVLERKAVESQNNEEPLTLFFPLCGKSVDMLHAAKAGHKVIGVDFIEEAALQFFTESKGILGNPKTTEIGDGEDKRKVVSSEDGSVQIILADMFKLKAENIGPVDLIVDRGALVAIDLDMHLPYSALNRSIIELSRKEGKNPGLLQFAIQYNVNPKAPIDSPHNISDATINDLYSAVFDNFETINVENITNELLCKRMMTEKIEEKSIYCH